MKELTVLVPTDRGDYAKKLVDFLLNKGKEEDSIDLEVILLNLGSKLIYDKNSNLDSFKELFFKNGNLLESKNKALKSIKTDWVLILDDDIRFKKSVLKKFLEYAGDKDFSFATGILFEKNRYSRYDPIHFTSYGKFSFYSVPSLSLHKIPKKEIFEVSFAPGGFLFAKTQVLKEFKYDTNFIYPFYNEDTDLTYRMTKMCYKGLCFSDIKANHLKAGFLGNRIKKQNWYYAFGFNNSYFRLKNFSFISFIFYLIFRFQDTLHILKTFSVKSYLQYLKGLYYGFKKGLKNRG